MEEPVVFGSYALLTSLGRGGMGDVCLARRLDGDPAPLVIKRIHRELADNELFIRRFEHEAVIALAVDSPHVAKVYDAGKVGDVLYIAMEHIVGWPLTAFIQALIASKHHASVHAVTAMMTGALEGLAALHEAKDPKTGARLGVVHRDISPKNLMIDVEGRVHVIDLGLGKSTAQDWKTQTGAVLGSLGYMAPEQVLARPLDQRTDVYAMAIVMYELLTLQYFVERTSAALMLQKSMDPGYEPTNVHRPDVPPALEAALEKALANDPHDRFPDARAFLGAIRAAVQGVSPGAAREHVDEVFGPKLLEKKRELARLLALPLPIPPEEPELTVTFVRPRVAESPLTATATPIALRAGRSRAVLTYVAIGLALASGALVALTLRPKSERVTIAPPARAIAAPPVSFAPVAAVYATPTPLPSPRSPAPAKAPPKKRVEPDELDLVAKTLEQGATQPGEFTRATEQLRAIARARLGDPDLISRVDKCVLVAAAKASAPAMATCAATLRGMLARPQEN